MDLSRALAIDGWMTEPELAWLWTAAQGHARIVEIGVYKGRSTRALAEATPGKVLAVDDWVGPRDVRRPPEDLLAVCTANLSDLLTGKKVELVTLAHEALAGLWLPEPPTMVFIDGDHTQTAVERDIRWACRQLQRGGVVCGHDRERFSVEAALRATLGWWAFGAGSLWFRVLDAPVGAMARGSRWPTTP
jgi:hypothetical protein